MPSTVICLHRGGFTSRHHQDVDGIVEIVRAQVDPVGHSYGGFLTGSRWSEQRTCERLAELSSCGTLEWFDALASTRHARIDAAIVEHVCAS